jgi:hypothetical protein
VPVLVSASDFAKLAFHVVDHRPNLRHRGLELTA